MRRIISEAGLDFSDEEIWRAPLRGDRDAFGIALRTLWRADFNSVYYRTATYNDAEDLTDRVFQRGHDHIVKLSRTAACSFPPGCIDAHKPGCQLHRDRSRRQEIPFQMPPLVAKRVPPESSWSHGQTAGITAQNDPFTAAERQTFADL